MNLLYGISFCVCLACFSFRTAFNYLKYRENPLAENKKLVTVIFVTMGVLWFAWFQMCFTDPVAIVLPLWLRVTGLFLFLCGVFLFVYAHTKLKGFDDKGILVTSGVFSKIRNPMYLGFILWITGFPVFLQSGMTLSSAVIWIPFFLYWKVLEERALEKKYPAYVEYKKRTWF